MSSCHYQFAHSLHDEVRIIALDCVGRVTGLMVTRDGIEYRVAYWFDGERKSEWLPEYELKSCTPKGD